MKTNFGLRTIVLIGVVAFALAGSAFYTQATTVTLLPTADTSLRSSAPDDPLGNSNPLLVGVAKSPATVTNHSLLKFDFSSIPANATITGATLTVTIYRSNTEPSNYDLNRVLVDWNEYEATWNNRNASTPWLLGGAQSGTEFVTMPSVTAQVDDAIFSSAGMIADVQLWVNNPGTNYGWIMIATGEVTGTGKQLGSRESDSPPSLTIDYTLSAPATPPTLFDMAAAENIFRFSFNAESNRTYSIDVCDALTNSHWNLLTNIPALPTNGILTVTNAISSATRFYRARTP